MSNIARSQRFTFPLSHAFRSLSVSLPGGRARIDAAGWLARARRIASPNCDARPAPCEVTLLVLHGISLPPGEFKGDAVERLFTNRLAPDAHPYFATISDLKVSAHFFIRRDGALVQFVSCEQRAWHAGASSWRGQTGCNDFSIGVELEGTDTWPYTARQYARLARLVQALRSRYPIRDLAGHSEIAPGRKTDPGPSFEWRRLRLLLGEGRRR